jgi:hypothetical protein
MQPVCCGAEYEYKKVLWIDLVQMHVHWGKVSLAVLCKEYD